MKRLVVFYSLSRNTEEAANKIAEMTGAETLKLETQKSMPKSFAAQIFVGGGQVMFNHIPKLKPLGKEIGDYDEIILGSPIWNGKGVPAINAFLEDEKAAAKVTALFFLSGGGDVKKGSMIGKVSDNGELDFFYHHLNMKDEIRAGKCHSVPAINAEGKIELHEEWQWLNGDCSCGRSVVVEK